MPLPSSPIIEVCSPAEWPAAFQLAFSHLDEPRRSRHTLNALTLARAGEIDSGGIFIARQQDRLIGVFVVVPLAGAGALVWPPRFRDAEPIVQDPLMRAGLDWLVARGTKVAQALLSAGETAYGAPLLRHGFRLITKLHYLGHGLHSDGTRLSPAESTAAAARLRWEPYSPANRELFHDILILTYE